MRIARRRDGKSVHESVTAAAQPSALVLLTAASAPSLHAASNALPVQSCLRLRRRLARLCGGPTSTVEGGDMGHNFTGCRRQLRGARGLPTNRAVFPKGIRNLPSGGQPRFGAQKTLEPDACALPLAGLVTRVRSDRRCQKTGQEVHGLAEPLALTGEFMGLGRLLASARAHAFEARAAPRAYFAEARATPTATTVATAAATLAHAAAGRADPG